ncbi:MAG: VOC family protein [Taibaiella sp.]|nr:VOC family protein [Taibaiella sp.]
MQNINFPAGYLQLMPYLIISNAAAFIQFTKNVFGANEKARHMRDEKTIMHAEINIGECVIMIADSTEKYGVRRGGFFIYVADADATCQLVLSHGATTITPVSDQPYGRSGGITDPFGNQWWVTAQNIA